MAAFRVKLAADTWTDITALYAKRHVVFRTPADDVTFGLQTTAPTTGTAVAADVATEVIMPGASVKLWVHSTAGAILEVDPVGPAAVYNSAVATGVVA